MILSFKNLSDKLLGYFLIKSALQNLLSSSKLSGKNLIINDTIKMYKCYTVTVEVNSMIIKSNIILNLKINSVEDLYKLKPLKENSSININKSQIAMELGGDRRTVDKYLNGFQKTKKRKKRSRLDKYYDVINELLSEQHSQVFYYKRILWQYLVDNHGLTDKLLTILYAFDSDTDKTSRISGTVIKVFVVCINGH